jgi:hypothetical protein
LTQIREIDGGNGYAGQSTRRAHFGLGTATRIDALEIRWPSGLIEKIGEMPVNRLAKITEGKGLVR